MLTEAQLKAMRDEKAVPTLEQYAPVYLVWEEIDLDKPAILFNVLFQHKLYFWVSRRYRYDGFNDVLYYMGQRRVTEAEAVEVQATHDPYISGVALDIPNSYGG
jgi:hypothetical protein